MKNWLNKEYVVKRKMWTLLFGTVIDALILTVLFFFCVTKYNTIIIELLNSISANNLGFTFSKIMFPILLISITILKIGFYIVVNGNVEVKKKNKK